MAKASFNMVFMIMFYLFVSGWLVTCGLARKDLETSHETLHGDTFMDRLQEGGACDPSGGCPIVCRVGPIEFVDHPLKLGINFETHVARGTEWSGDDRFFNFTDFKTIVELEASTTLSIDVIGVLRENEPLTHFKTKDKRDSVKMRIKLEDLKGESIYVTLFDAFAHQLLNYLAAHEEPHYVIILQFGRFAIYEGRHSVSNAFDGTNLFINSHDVKETSTFLESFLQTVDSPKTPSYSRASSGVTYNMELDFLEVTAFNHTAEVQGIEEANKVIVLGTVKMIYDTWYYQACKRCIKIVQPTTEALPLTEDVPLAITDGQPLPITREQPQSLTETEPQPISQDQSVAKTETEPQPITEAVTGICNNSDCKSYKKVIQPFPRVLNLICVICIRFKIGLKVQDSSGTVNLTLFDGEAKKLLHKSASEVLSNFQREKNAVNDDVDLKVPTEIQALLERKYAFKIDVSEFNIKKRYKFYTVEKVTDDQKIMKALEEKYSSDQVSYIIFINLDVVSFTGDNETPLSVNTVLSRGEGSQAADLKRNLDEVYDEDLPITSPAKATPSSVKSDSNSKSDNGSFVKEKLLIPKVEK
ncbi:hypothetical protein SSX86_032406 [Deinandra increscens subsp. villosa]|uniref:Replication protein A OB domain-containing protein n=1 Tax=Deinandra increscens subsp. villosa TaxID=3103831 RepID=A0AAP0GHS7_9ASTR